MTITARLPRKLTLDTFLAFYATRPDEEQWQLVDGIAILMTPPFLTHQRVAGNLQRLLNAAFETTRRTSTRNSASESNCRSSPLLGPSRTWPS